MKIDGKAIRQSLETAAAFCRGAVSQADWRRMSSTLAVFW
jgi:hypothetical protein